MNIMVILDDAKTKLQYIDQETIELSIKSCCVWLKLHPLFYVSSLPSYYLQSHEILLNKGRNIETHGEMH
jgi:hypothetical protein